MMATDKNRKELNIGDNVLYVANKPASFTFRGVVVNIVPVGPARDGEMLHLVDVNVNFINKIPANPGQTVRAWSGELQKHDAERTAFV